MSNEKANSSKMKTLNKWLTKLFDKRIVSNKEFNAIMSECHRLTYAVKCFKASDPEVIGYESDYSVYAKKGGLSVLMGIFLFNPKSEESIKYAKVCAEDLADALREAEQYELIK